MIVATSTSPNDHPDRLKWNQKYLRANPTFTPAWWMDQILAHKPPEGPALELASGPSGTVLALAALGRYVTALDLSDLALSQLSEEAERRGLAERVTVRHTDLERWQPDGPDYALVLCSFFWSPTLFAQACAAVSPGGILCWQAPALTDPPSSHVRPEWCLAPGEPANLLPPHFEVVHDSDTARGGEVVRTLIARHVPE